MPAAKSMQIRREMVRRREGGETLASISRELGVGYETVRKVWGRYQQTGEVEPRYAACVHTEIRKSRVIYECAIALKRSHPSWGAGLIRVELAGQVEGADLPSQRTLQRWFRRGGVANPRPNHQAKVSVTRGKEPHEVWAVDAKEQIRLGDGSSVSWLTVTDEGSGAILDAVLFPPEPLATRRPATSQASAPGRPDALGTS